MLLMSFVRMAHVEGTTANKGRGTFIPWRTSENTRMSGRLFTSHCGKSCSWHRTGF